MSNGWGTKVMFLGLMQLIKDAKIIYTLVIKILNVLKNFISESKTKILREKKNSYIYKKLKDINVDRIKQIKVFFT